MVCLVVGDANADLLGSLEFFPTEGDDAPMTALGFSSGGTAANVAVAHARLGGSARLLTRVGDDPAAEVALRAARHAGVELTFLQHDPRIATGLCFAAISPNGERTFFSHRGANVELELPSMNEVFRDAQWLHVSGHALLEGKQRQTTMALLAEARRRGISTSVDLCLPLLRKHPRDVIPRVNDEMVVFANDQELRFLGTSLGCSADANDADEAAISALMKAGARLVVAKRGASGSSVAQGSSRIDIAPFPVKAIDTTGAGDGFVAAFLYVLQRGGAPNVAGRIANISGALIASRRGAAEASPTRNEVYAALATCGDTETLDAFRRLAQETQS
ncbi:MAG TPA: carbohydrate kinase family protein [Polyangium sp.]|nr:carbohydrate kinase family protein [Polyangium sp.]